MKWSRVQAGQAKESKLCASCLCCFSRCVCTFMPVWDIEKQSNRPSTQNDGMANFIFDLDQFWNCSSTRAREWTNA